MVLLTKVLSVCLGSRSAAGFLKTRKKIPPKGGIPMKGLMPGSNPVIRTKQYLEQGIALRDSIKIMMINYGDYEETKHLHDGAR